MPDKSDEILLAIASLKDELKQISAGVRNLRDTVSTAPPGPTGTGSVEEGLLLAQTLKQYCVFALPQLERLTEPAQQNGQAVAVKRLISRVSQHANSKPDDLAGKGGLFLRTELEKLETAINLVKARAASVPKPATTPIPFSPLTQQLPSQSSPAKGAQGATINRKTNVPAAEHRSNSVGKEKRAAAAGARAS